MNQELVVSIKEEFYKLIEKKNSWGKNEVKSVLLEAVMIATAKYIDKN